MKVEEILSKGKFDFSGLFVLDMANNHQGSVDHGKRIINEFAPVVKNAGVRAAVKLQFRNLDTFIHPDFRNSTAEENKHIPRFLSTELSKAEFGQLVAEIRNAGLITMSTPFDEESVDLLVELGIDILKIASCSAKDWPLLVKAAKAGKPIIVSTAGLSIDEIDNVVSFLDHRSAPFAIMHCVAVYPTPNFGLHLNQIELLRERFPKVTIGFSTHEDPDNLSAIQIAYAKGAQMFERHIGVPTDEIKLNAYSSTPQQIEKWLAAYRNAVKSCGPELYATSTKEEQQSLKSLMRGVYLKRDVKEGQLISRDDVFFAVPLQSGQMTSSQWHESITSDRDYQAKQPLLNVYPARGSVKTRTIAEVIHQLKAMLSIAKIDLGHDFELELSHHYGIERFKEVGAIIFDCINREYCKKILVLLPGQVHPYHHHEKKEEMFQMLAGDLTVEIEGRQRKLYPGDKVLVQRGLRHSFWTERGAIFEEISTTHYNDDSTYEDPAINQMDRSERKTKLVNWGRHQF